MTNLQRDSHYCFILSHTRLGDLRLVVSAIVGKHILWTEDEAFPPGRAIASSLKRPGFDLVVIMTAPRSGKHRLAVEWGFYHDVCHIRLNHYVPGTIRFGDHGAAEELSVNLCTIAHMYITFVEVGKLASKADLFHLTCTSHGGTAPIFPWSSADFDEEVDRISKIWHTLRF